MAANEIHKGDNGTILEVTVKDGASAVDISSATIKDFIFRKPAPNSEVVLQSGVFTNDGTDGLLRFTVATSGFLDTVGKWDIQVFVSITGCTCKSDIGSFTVHDNLQ
jgi:hypothetical protein